jgi:hypothetical protein
MEADFRKNLHDFSRGAVDHRLGTDLSEVGQSSRLSNSVARSSEEVPQTYR